MSEKFIDREYLLDSFKDYNTDIVEKKFDKVNSNLDALEFGEVAGGKNVFDLSKINFIDVEYGNGVYTNKITDSRTYFNACIDYWNDDVYINVYPEDAIIVDAKGRYSITGKIPKGCTKIRFKHNGATHDIVFFITPISYFGLKVGDTFTISIDVDGYNPSTAGGLIVKNIQIEEGTQATEYEPYKDGGTVHIDSTTEFPLLGLNSFDGITNIISPCNVEVTYAKSDSGVAILDMSENKLDKDNVVNNQNTTVEGYALDARQANPNIDGTLAKQVADLNGSLYGVTSNIFSMVTSDSIEFQSAIETKIGNLIVLQATFHVKQNIASWQNLIFSQYSNENIIMLGGMFQSQNTNKAYVAVESPGKYVAIRTDNSGIGNDDWLRGFAILCITSTK